MNQDEQPGENIFIMPDSLKKSDLVTVFNIPFLDWYTTSKIDDSDGSWQSNVLETSFTCHQHKVAITTRSNMSVVPYWNEFKIENRF